MYNQQSNHICLCVHRELRTNVRRRDRQLQPGDVRRGGEGVCVCVREHVCVCVWMRASFSVFNTGVEMLMRDSKDQQNTGMINDCFMSILYEETRGQI